MVHRLGRILAPGEGAVADADHAWDGRGLNAPLLKSVHNDDPGVFLIVLLQLTLGQMAGAGDGAVKVVGVGGAEAGDILPRLGPGHGVGAVGVDNAPHARERLVQLQMGLGIAGGLPLALHPLAGLQADHHHVSGGHAVVLHPGGLDDHQPLVPVDPRHVAPGKGDQPVFGQEKVGLQHFLLELF